MTSVASLENGVVVGFHLLAFHFRCSTIKRNLNILNMARWRESEYARGQEDFYERIFQKIVTESVEEQKVVEERVDLVARALYAFNTGDADQGRRQTTAQNVYKIEIARYILMFWKLDVEGDRMYGDFFETHPATNNYTTIQLQQLGKKIVERLVKAQNDGVKIMNSGMPEECVTPCAWKRENMCACDTEEGLKRCPPEACGIEHMPRRSLKNLARDLLQFANGMPRGGG